MQYDYPALESITSLLPLVDEMILAIGDCEDGTLELVESLNEPKIKIIRTVWDENLREGGRVLAEETNKALAQVSKEADWAFYLQGDEVLHEEDYAAIKQHMMLHKDNASVDGLLFQYRHFYGSFDFIGSSSNWYSNEIRIIRPNRGIYSYKDAQGFRKGENKKLWVKAIPAHIHHYGWVRKPEQMQAKQSNFAKLYRGAEDNSYGHHLVFDYEAHVNSIQPFKGTHPQVMKERIANKNWQFDYDISMSQLRLKDRIKKAFKNLGWDLNYKNYKVLR